MNYFTACHVAGGMLKYKATISTSISLRFLDEREKYGSSFRNRSHRIRIFIIQLLFSFSLSEGHSKQAWNPPESDQMKMTLNAALCQASNKQACWLAVRRMKNNATVAKNFPQRRIINSNTFLPILAGKSRREMETHAIFSLLERKCHVSETLSAA